MPLQVLVPHAIAAAGAVTAAVAAAWIGSRNKKRMETGNGRTIGETVHETAGLVELVAAMMHTNTEEVLALANKLDEHITDSVDYLREAREVHDKLFTALADLQEKEG